MSLALRGVALAAVWVLLAGRAPATLAVGAAVVAAALAWSQRVLPTASRWRLRPAGLLRFAPYFLWHSLRGGVDVAVRALRPRMALNPRFEVYPLRLPEGAPRTFFMNVVSLLPGTLSAGLAGHDLTVHVIGEAAPVTDRLRALEERVADVFATSAGRGRHRSHGARG